MMSKQRSTVFAATFLAAAQTAYIAGAAEIPVPRPKPATIGPPPAHDSKPGEAAPRPAVQTPDPPPLTQPVPVHDPAQFKSCLKDLRSLGAKFQIGESIAAAPPCGIRQPILLTGLAKGVTVTGNVRVNCATARGLARWVRNVVVPSASLHLDKQLATVKVSTSYQCRRRNNSANGKYSEHAFGNGVDVMSFVFEDGAEVPIADRSSSAAPERAFQAAIRGGSCAYFTTVLGPMTNDAHATHLHLDNVARRSGYRLCQ